MSKIKMFVVIFVFASFATLAAQEFDFGGLYDQFLVQDFEEVSVEGSKEDSTEFSTEYYKSKSGLVTSLNLNFGLPLEYGNEVYGFDYETAAILELGYLFDLGDRSAITLAAEFGYNVSSISSVDKYQSMSKDLIDRLYVGSILVGAMPKINIGQVSLGFGGGVKIPVTGVAVSSVYYTDCFDISGTKIIDDIDLSAYIKAVIDYSFFFDTKTAFVVGVNMMYNFDTGYNALKASQQGYYVGCSLGVKFAPKL